MPLQLMMLVDFGVNYPDFDEQVSGFTELQIIKNLG